MPVKKDEELDIHQLEQKYNDQYKDQESDKIDFAILRKLIIVCVLGFVVPLILELTLGYNNFFAYFWILIGIAFHEIGHFALVPFQGLIEIMAGYMGSCFFALATLWFSLFLQSRINRELLSKKASILAFNFMFIGFVNLYFLYVTLTHKYLVVGPGADFTLTSQITGISLDKIFIYLWIVNGIIYVIAILICLCYIYRSYVVEFVREKMIDSKGL